MSCNGLKVSRDKAQWMFKPGFHMIATIATIAAQQSQRSLRSLRAYRNIHSAFFAIVATLDRNDRRDRNFSVSAIVVLRSLRSYGNQALVFTLMLFVFLFACKSFTLVIVAHCSSFLVLVPTR